MAPTPVVLPGKSHGQRGGLQSMGSQESDIIEGLSTHTHTHTHTRILKVYIYISYMSCCIFNLYHI